ncbi:MAG: signal peptidase I [Clostridia bacterium]|nr:signal peptidase I [Clostridia bacterium]MDD4048430.1 signal peptidase I [Clostridia bacterium]
MYSIRREQKRTKVRCIILLSLLLLTEFIRNTTFISFFQSITFISYGRPLLWLGIALVVYMFPRAKAVGRLSLQKFIISLALGSAIIYVAFMMVGGMLTSFGKTPYALCVNNLIYIGSFSLGIEAARAYLINSYKGKNIMAIVGIISIIFALTSLSYRGILNIKTGLAFVRYMGSVAGPALSESLLISYFAYLGGFVPAAIFHFVLLIFERFCPILPNLSWGMKTFICCFVPIFSLIFVQHLYSIQARLIKRNSGDDEQIFGWIVTSVASVLIIWFAAGMFSIYPSVIVTGSMEPIIKPGDIVLMEKIKGKEAKLDDVIQYYDTEEEINITHRVISFNEGKEKTLMTKGDNNSCSDFSPIEFSQVKGRMIATIPKIGWLTLIMRSNGEIPEGVVN